MPGSSVNEARLRRLLLAWPGTGVGIKWDDDLVFTVDAKMFCITARGRDDAPISFKVDAERFLELTDRPGIVPAPYLARAHWVMAERAALPASELEALLRRSYELVVAKLSQRRQRELRSS